MEHQLTAGLLAHQSRISHSRYPATSSAFSASAHPHEDWTKISDLAERRRIQNRIAQRNYRKKLKRRLEDLERKAASTESTPEPQPAQLARPPKPASVPSRKNTLSSTPVSLSSSPQKPSAMSPQHAHQRSLSALMSLPEPSLFSDSYARPLSLTPPTSFTYPTTTSEQYGLMPFSTSSQYATATSTASQSTDGYAFNYSLLASPWLSTSSASASQASTPPFSNFKQDSFTPAELDLSSFAYRYGPSTAALASLESVHAQYDSMPQTPPLSDCHDLYVAGASPPDSAFLPQTPPMGMMVGPTLAMV